MAEHTAAVPPDSGRQVSCPVCGAVVPVVGERWLHVHREGSAEYAYPRGDGERRCPGSLLPAVEQPPRQRGASDDFSSHQREGFDGGAAGSP